VEYFAHTDYQINSEDLQKFVIKKVVQTTEQKVEMSRDTEYMNTLTNQTLTLIEERDQPTIRTEASFRSVSSCIIGKSVEDYMPYISSLCHLLTGSCSFYRSVDNCWAHKLIKFEDEKPMMSQDQVLTTVSPLRD